MTDTITKQEPKLSVRKPGHWRNKWCSTTGWGYIHPGNIIVDEYTNLSGRKYLSAEQAEQVAIEKMREHFASGGDWEGEEHTTFYLGPVFFPEGDEQ